MAFAKTNRPKTAAAAPLTITEMDRQARELLDGLKPLDAYRTDPAKLRKPAETPAAPQRNTVDRNLYPYGLDPIDPGQRRVAGACGICGLISKPPPEGPQSSFQTEIYPKRLRVRGVEYGLPQVKGETDFVRLELCRNCSDAWEKGGDYFYERGGLPANAGFAASKRLRDPKHGRPALLDWLPAAEILPLEKLAEYTFAGLTIQARLDGRPGPQPSEVPFGWLEDARIDKRKKRKTA